MTDRRMATPHYKKTAERDYAFAATFTVVLAFVTGAMLGAAIAIGWMV